MQTRSALPPSPQPLQLALQGGGSHGAFTWGVLDALLEDGGLRFPAISGTSAGALNAVALAAGWAGALRAGGEPAAGARACLRSVWEDVMAMGTVGAVQRQLAGPFFGAAPSLAALFAATALGFPPLRQLLERRIDFGALRHPGAPRVFLGATHVRSGRAAIFTGAGVTADAVLASACLPQLFPPVVIDGEAYWDGGYSVNPPLAPLLRAGGGDVLLVQINPVLRPTLPATPQDVQARSQELTFNAGLLSQIRAVEHVNQLVELGLLPRQQHVRLHRIDGGAGMQQLPQWSRMDADAAMVRTLFALGRQAAADWLAHHRGALGRRDTLDYAEYADDTWLHFAPLLRPPASPRRRWPLAKGRRLL